MKELIEQAIKYGLFGAVTTGINLILFFILDQCGIYYLLANGIAYYIAVIINYFFNYYLVFEHSKETRKVICSKLLQFIGLRTASFLVDTALFFVLVSVLRGNKYMCRIGLSIAIILVNYIWSKKKIFIKEESE